MSLSTTKPVRVIPEPNNDHEYLLNKGYKYEVDEHGVGRYYYWDWLAPDVLILENADVLEDLLDDWRLLWRKRNYTA